MRRPPNYKQIHPDVHGRRISYECTQARVHSQPTYNPRANPPQVVAAPVSADPSVPPEAMALAHAAAQRVLMVRHPVNELSRLLVDFIPIFSNIEYYRFVRTA